MVTSYPPIPSQRAATVSIIPTAESRWEVVGHYSLVLFFTVAGTILTWTGHNIIKINPVFTSSTVGLIAHAIYPRYSAPAYAGSFAGMATTVVIPQAYWTLVLAIFVFSFFSVFDRFGILQGIGGRLGTTALFSCLLMLPVLYWIVPGYHHTFWSPDRYNDIDWVFGVCAILLSTASSIVTILLRSHVKTLEHPVPSASVVALSVAFVLLSIEYEKNDLLLIYTYIGMSVGMSGREVIKNYPTYVILGAFTGGLGLAFHGLSTGDNGGKAGFTAMVGVVIWQWIVLPIWRRVRDYLCPCFASSSYSSFSVRGRRKSILSDLEEPVLTQASHSVWTSSSKRVSEDRDLENEIRGRLAADSGDEGLEDVVSLGGGLEGDGLQSLIAKPHHQPPRRSGRPSVEMSFPEGEEEEEEAEQWQQHLRDPQERRQSGAGRANTLGAMSFEEDISASIDAGARGMGSKF